MPSKFSNQIIANINNNIPWDQWSEGSRCAFAASLSPVIQMDKDQKGATDTQWESIRLMRHIFNTGRLPLPSFVIKQWFSIPGDKRGFWVSIGEEARPLILEKTKRTPLKVGAK